MKQEIISFYLSQIETKINQLHQQIIDLSVDAQNDAKSSAGDKHETGLAMMHLEQEKLNAKLAESLIHKTEIQSLKTDIVYKKAIKGAMVETDDFVFLISVALPQINIQNKTVFGLSLSAPLASKMIGLSVGDVIEIGTKKQKIINIE